MVKICIRIRSCNDVNDLVVECHKMYRLHEHSYRLLHIIQCNKLHRGNGSFI
jgi:hypothetical protein